VKRAIIYARVSTEDQAEHGYSLPDEEWRTFLTSVGANLRAVPVAR